MTPISRALVLTISEPAIFILGADHLTLEEVGLGGGGGDDFENKILAGACWRKKIACSTNEIEINSCTATSKKKNAAKLFHHSCGALQTPSKTATIPDNSKSASHSG